jgi:AraC family transcriptional regulator
MSSKKKLVVTNNQTERKLVNSYQVENRRVGRDIIFIPAQVAHWLVNFQETEFLLLVFDSQFISYGIGMISKSELESGQTCDRLDFGSLSTTLAMHLLRHYCSRRPTRREDRDGLPPYKLKLVLSYIHEHLGENIKLSELAAVLDMSQYYFCRLFKQSMGITPYQYVLQQRVERAKQLLGRKDIEIAQISLEVGLKSQSYLTRIFRRYTGFTPKVYRDRL